MGRFSKQELFELRNNIPVDVLIKDQLQMVYKNRDGQLRFLCPLCREFNTATKAVTNLARCFRCEKNFNPIDLVMTVNGTSFVDSVHYLKRILEDITFHETQKAGLATMLKKIGNMEMNDGC